MKAVKFNEMKDDELNVKLNELRQELFNLRFSHATGQLANPCRWLTASATSPESKRFFVSASLKRLNGGNDNVRSN